MNKLDIIIIIPNSRSKILFWNLFYFQYNTAVLSQKAVSAFSISEQILPFGLAERYKCDVTFIGVVIQCLELRS